MRAEDQLFELLDDLERQAAAAYAEEREWEIADVARADYAQVTLASRLMASLESDVSLEVAGIGRLAGRLVRLGDGWLVLAGRSTWLVVLPAVISVTGASARSRHEDSWDLRHRLGLRSVLERLAEQGSHCLIHRCDGSSASSRISRIGADFVEAEERGPGHETLIALTQIAAVQLEAIAELG